MKNILFTLLIISFLPAYSQTSLPSFFSNGMVLQQQEKVAFWGTDAPDTKIRITASWGEEVKSETDGEGNWKIEIATPEAGGPYSISIDGSKTIELENVLIGEVWLCSGQSNMDMPVKGFTNQPVLGSNEAILNSANDQIRFFNTAREASLVPLDDVEGKWTAANPATTGDFSATAYFFARKLQEILDVPVGIITTSWGGSRIEAWLDANTLKQFDHIALPTTLPEKSQNKIPTLLYNAMLHPFVGFNIQGMLWYQGEANSGNADVYKELFPAMIRSWRTKWQQHNFPFYFVQIAPFGYKNVNSAFLREAQLHTMQTVDHTGMAVTLDIGNCRNIHPSKKKKVGGRLAYWALANTYQIDGIVYSGPIYKSSEITGDGKINIEFDYADNGLTSFEQELTGFTIAGEDKVFYPAKAKINRNRTVTVWSKEVPAPVAVRYAFENCVEGTLYNVGGLPASSFRTDSWESEEIDL